MIKLKMVEDLKDWLKGIAAIYSMSRLKKSSVD